MCLEAHYIYMARH